MNKNKLILNKQSEKLDLDSIEDLRGTDYITQLEIELKNDVLYVLLKKSNRHNNIITDKIRAGVKEGVYYSTPEVSMLIDAPQSTVRGWINELKDYIDPVIQGGRFIKLSPKSVLKLRMISMLRESNEYSVTYLKQLTGIEVIENEEEDEKELILSERVVQLEKEIKKMTSTINNMGKAMTILGELIDYDEYQKSGKVMLNKTKMIALLEDSSNKRLKEIEKRLNEDIKEKIEKKSYEIENKLNEEIKKQEDTIKSFTKEEVKRIMEERRKKSWVEKLFGKKK